MSRDIAMSFYSSISGSMTLHHDTSKLLLPTDWIVSFKTRAT